MGGSERTVKDIENFKALVKEICASKSYAGGTDIELQPADESRLNTCLDNIARGLWVRFAGGKERAVDKFLAKRGPKVIPPVDICNEFSSHLDRHATMFAVFYLVGLTERERGLRVVRPPKVEYFRGGQAPNKESADAFIAFTPNVNPNDYARFKEIQSQIVSETESVVNWVSNAHDKVELAL